MKRPQVVVFDLDGTLLPESKRITPRAHRVLRELHARGTAIVLATGKFFHLAAAYGRELDLDCAVVGLDGARNAIGKGGGSDAGEPISQAMAPELVHELLERYERPHWPTFADDGADELLLRTDDRESLELATSAWASRFRHVDSVREEVRGPCGVLSFYGPEDEMRTVTRDLQSTDAPIRFHQVESYLLGCHRVTIQPQGVTKGSGLLEVLKRRGVAPSDCMVFGDWHNDRPMFEIGCVNVAMRNAVPELHELADFVTDSSNEEDGVAEFLEQRVLAS